MSNIDSNAKIMIVTGEASGDLHGANLLRAMKRLTVKQGAPETHFFGVGGQRMVEEGCEILIPSEEISVMGLVEVLGHFPVIWKAFQRLKKVLHEQKPQALVLIDFPEFNLRLARQAKLAGVPVLYYVSPQVWAWRRGRVRKIAELVDSLAAIFPFEPQLYNGLDINVQYVGHPLLDEFAESVVEPEAKTRLQLPQDKKIVGLFPGSRRNELHFMLDTIVETARLIKQQHQAVHFVVPVAETLKNEQIAQRFGDNLPISFVDSADADIYTIARCCDTVLSVSGTVTLQVALAGTPMAILYKLSPISYGIGKHLVKVDHIGLANIVAEKRIVPEFVQDDATPETLASEIVKQLTDADYAAQMRSDLSMVKQQLGSPGCSGRVAAMLSQLITDESSH